MNLPSIRVSLMNIRVPVVESCPCHQISRPCTGTNTVIVITKSRDCVVMLQHLQGLSTSNEKANFTTHKKRTISPMGTSGWVMFTVLAKCSTNAVFNNKTRPLSNQKKTSYMLAKTIAEIKSTFINSHVSEVQSVQSNKRCVFKILRYIQDINNIYIST